MCDILFDSALTRGKQILGEGTRGERWESGYCIVEQTKKCRQLDLENVGVPYWEDTWKVGSSLDFSFSSSRKIFKSH